MTKVYLVAKDHDRTRDRRSRLDVGSVVKYRSVIRHNGFPERQSFSFPFSFKSYIGVV